MSQYARRTTTPLACNWKFQTYRPQKWRAYSLIADRRPFGQEFADPAGSVFCGLAAVSTAVRRPLSWRSPPALDGTDLPVSGHGGRRDLPSHQPVSSAELDIPSASCARIRRHRFSGRSSGWLLALAIDRAVVLITTTTVNLAGCSELRPDAGHVLAPEGSAIPSDPSINGCPWHG